MKRSRGFTLVEILVSVIILGILSFSVLSICVGANRYWKRGNQQSSSQANARASFQTILNELKQALPDSDPGRVNPATGYLSIAPAVAPTGVLSPNANAPNSVTLTFTEPNTANYTPFAVGWNPNSPLNYKKINYAVQGGNTLQRTETAYNDDGSAASTRTDPILESKTGTLALKVRYLAADLFNVSVTADENGETHALASDVYLEEK